MTRAQKSSTYGLRAVLLGASLVAATACSGVTIAPDDPAWRVTGEGSEANAVWGAGDVEVVVPLRHAADATHVAADVLHRGPDPAQVTFFVPSVSAALLPLGTVSGGPPTFERPWSETLYPGRPVELPPGAPDRPGTLRITLRPDTRWSADDPPVVGSGVTLGIALTMQSGSFDCAFRFRVTESSGGGWKGMSEASRTLVVVLLSAAIVGVSLWAGA